MARMAVTEVVGLIGGVLSGLGTPAAIWLAVRTWRREAERARGEESLRRRQQPSRVVVRTEPASWPRIDGQGDYLTRVATVVNASEEPVFDVTLFWHEGDDVTNHAASRVALMPGESWQQPMPLPLAHSAACGLVFASIWFFDVDERGWRRGPRGRLERIRDQLAA